MELDSLEIKIKGEAKTASQQIDSLVQRLSTLKTALSGLGSSSQSLTSLSASVKNLSNSMAALKTSGVTSKDFSNLAQNIKKLTTIDTAKISELSSSLGQLSQGMAQISAINYNGDNLLTFANAYKKLGTTNATNAVTNMQQMSNGLADFVTKINQTGTINFDSESLVNFANALAKLGGLKVTQSAKNMPLLRSYVVSFVREMNDIGTLSFDTTNFVELVKAIGKLGSKTAIEATKNLPNLSNALKQLITQLSTAPQVSTNITNLITSLSNLRGVSTRYLGGIGNSARNGTNSTLSLKNAIGKLSASMRSGSMSAKSFAHYAGKLYANFFLLIRAAKGVGNAIMSSMDYIEEYNYFNVTLGKIASQWKDDYTKYGYEDADAYADSFRSRMTETLGKMTGYQVNSNGTLSDLQTKNLGLDMTALMNYQAGLLQVTNAMGQTGEASVTTAKLLSMLAGDMSSFRNTDLSQVMDNFQSALLGQSRAVYKYGLDITQATLQQQALELGITKSVKSMTQGEKAQLRTIAMVEQSRVSWGDLANTISSPSNQLRMLQNNFKALSRTIGNVFLPAVAAVLPYVNGLVIAIKRLFEWTADMMGVDLSSIIDNSGAGYSDAFDDVEESADDTTESVKKLKNELMGFDRINKLSDVSDSGSKTSADNGTIDLTSQLKDALSDYEKVWNDAFDKMNSKSEDVANNIISLFKTGDWGSVATIVSSSVATALEGINWKPVYAKAKGFGKGLAQFLNNLITPRLFSSVGKTIASALNTKIYAFLSFGDNFDWSNFGNSFAEGVNRFFKEFDFKALGSALNIWTLGLIKALYKFVSKTNWNKIGTAIGEGFNKIDFGKIAWNFTKLVASIIKGIADTIGGFVDTSPIASALILLFATMKYSGVASTLGKSLTKELAATGIKLGNAKIGLALGAATITLMASKSDLAKLVGAPITAALSTYQFTGRIDLALTVGTVIFAAESIQKITKPLRDLLFNETNVDMNSIGYLDKFKESYNTLLDDLKQTRTDIDESTEAIQNLVNGTDDTSEEVLEVERLWKEYDTLYRKENKSAEEKEQLRKAGRRLAKIMPDLNDLINEENGYIATNIDYMKNRIEQKKKEMELTAIEEMYTKAVKEKYKAEIEAEKIQQKITESTKKLGKANYELQDATEKYNKAVSEGNSEEQDKWAQAMSLAAANIKAAEDELSIYNGELKTHKEKVKQASTNLEILDGKYDEISGSIKTAAGDTKGFGNTTKTSTDKAKNATKDLKDKGTKNVSTFVENANKTLASIKNPEIEILMKGAVTAAQSGAEAIQKMFNEIQMPDFKITENVKDVGKTAGKVAKTAVLSLFSTVTKNTSIKIPKYATGGTPDKGQLFVAREAGPELVGNIGGKTSVANNDQIVESVAKGVARAVSEVLGNQKQNVNITIEGDTSKMFKAVQKEAKSYTTMTGRPAF